MAPKIRKVAAWGAATLLAATLAILIAVAQTNADRPPGVRSDRWLSINEHAGIALSDRAPSRPFELNGTLMIKSQGLWLPVYLAAGPPGFMPLAR